MGKKRHTAEEIVVKLRQVDVLTGQGRTVAEAIRQIGVTEVTYYRWRSEYGGLKSDQIKRLKELEMENARLRRAVSDLTLEKLILCGRAATTSRRHPRWSPRRASSPCRQRARGRSIRGRRFTTGYTMDTPAMIMRLTNVGSQYLMGFTDADKHPFDGARTYKVTLPKYIPAARFWSLTLYDNQTRSMLQTPQRYPRAGNQTYPSPAAIANADGSTTVYFGPTKPADAKEGTWIQTTPGKGFFVILRLYSPLESFFDRSWRPSEVELVR